jgi:TonB family protein
MRLFLTLLLLKIATCTYAQINIDIQDRKDIKDSSILNNLKYVTPDTLAEFPGGSAAYSDFIRKNLKYPGSALENNIQGRVYVRFIVCTDGSVCNIAIDEAKSAADNALRKEALRVVSKTPKWKPAKIKDKEVMCYYTLPINFKLVE